MEIEPLRRVGIDISTARMQQELYTLGIEKNVNTLSQADKSMLRYIAVLKQTSNAQGDMAATLNTPANSFRVLNAQIQIASRWLGAIFIPLLSKLISWAIAAAKAVGMIAREIALFFGFELPEIQMPDTSSTLAGASAGLDDVSESAKNAKKNMDNLIGGFDELHILNKDNGGSGSGDDSIGNILGGIDLPEYNMFERYADNDFNEKAQKLYTIMKNALPYAAGIATALGAWTIAKGLLTDIAKVSKGIAGIKVGKDVLKLLGKGTRIAAGITLAVTGFTIEAMGAYNIGYKGLGGASLEDYLKTSIGAALGIGGSLLLFGTGPLGWTIGITAAITVALGSIYIGQKDSLKDQIKDAFFTGEGGISIQSITDSFKDSYKQVHETAEEVSTLTSNLNDNKEAISDNAAAVREAIGNLNTLTNEDISTMNQNLDSLGDSLIDNVQYNGDIVFTALQNASSAAATNLGLDVDSMLSALSRFKEQTSDSINTATQKIGELAEKKATIGLTETEEAELQKYIGYIGDLTYNSSGASIEVKNLKELLGKINWGSNADEGKRLIDELTQAYKDLNQEVDDTYKQSMDSLQQLNAQFETSLQYGMISQEAYDSWAEVSKDIANAITEGYESNKASIQADMNAVGEKLQGDLNETKESVMKDACSDIGERYAYWFQQGLKNDKIRLEKNAITEAFQPIQDAIDEFVETTGATLETGATTSAELYALGLESAESKKNIEQGTGAFKDEIIASFSSASFYKDLTKLAKEAGKKYSDAFSSNISISVSSSDGWTTSNHSKPKGYAAGGYPRKAQLFYARENGIPEMVGQVGGQTAVANNDQIENAIANAVYKAMSSAMSQFNGSQDINVNVVAELDGETVYKNQQKVAAKRGYAFNMGAFAR